MKAKILGVLAAVACVLGSFLMADSSYALTCPDGTLRGKGAVVNSYAECNIPEDEADGGDLMNTVVNVINVIVGVVGILAVVVIVIGAVLFVVSTGEAAKTTRARNTILYGVVGLIVSLLAFAIVNFVLSAVFNSSKDEDGHAATSVIALE